jgi:hypothetical protein
MTRFGHGLRPLHFQDGSALAGDYRCLSIKAHADGVSEERALAIVKGGNKIGLLLNELYDADNVRVK